MRANKSTEGRQIARDSKEEKDGDQEVLEISVGLNRTLMMLIPDAPLYNSYSRDRETGALQVLLNCTSHLS